VIDGRVLMKDRVLVDADEQKIMADSRQQAQSLWDRVNQ
jgi:hypothetical protein